MKKTTLLGLSLLPILTVACEESSRNEPSPPTPIDAGFTPITPSNDGGSPPTGNERPDFDKMARGGDCPAAVGPGVDHSGDITADQVWKASDGVHRVASTVRVLATVTLEACARVELDTSGGLTVGSSSTSGKLVAQGSFSDGKLLPVVITAKSMANRWGAIVVDSTGSLDLSYAVVSGGDSLASQQNGGGMIRVFGVSSTSAGGTPVITKSFRSRWALVDGALSYGINLLSYAGFTDDSSGVAVRGTATGPQGGPIKIEVGAVQALPANLYLANNMSDEVFVEQTWSGTLSHTYRNLGYPYHVMQGISLQPAEDGPPAVMTVEPGVTLRFDDGRNTSGVKVGATDKRQGVIVARGTADKPIVMTSAKLPAAPGNWRGIYFSEYPAAGHAFEYVTFEYAGGDSSATGFGCGPADNDATILILNQRPSESWVKNCTFRNGGGGTGIVSGWVSDEPGPDFKATNKFEGMPACHVSRWRSANNSCPSAGVTPDCL